MASEATASVVTTSVAVTSVASLSAVQAGQMVEWVANSLLHMQMPEQVALTFGATLIPAFHSLYNTLLDKIAASKMVSPARLAAAEAVIEGLRETVADLQARVPASASAAPVVPPPAEVKPGIGVGTGNLASTQQQPSFGGVPGKKEPTA